MKLSSLSLVFMCGFFSTSCAQLPLESRYEGLNRKLSQKFGALTSSRSSKLQEDQKARSVSSFASGSSGALNEVGESSLKEESPAAHLAANTATNPAASSAASPVANPAVNKEVSQKPLPSSPSVASDIVRLESVLSDQEQLLQNLMGRLSLLEEQANSGQSKQNKFQQYEKALLELQAKINSLEAQLLSQEKARKAARQKKKSAPQSKSKPFSKGEAAYKAKNWLDAVEFYNVYRTQYPRGTRYVEATLKTGLALHKAGNPELAKPYFKEIVTRFPNSSQAAKARKYL